MPELMATLKAIFEKEHRSNKFAAAMQGIDLEGNIEKKGEDRPVTFEEVKARAIARVTGNQEQANAALYGFDNMDGTSYKLIGL
jgi:hypothetical protein